MYGFVAGTVRSGRTLRTSGAAARCVAPRDAVARAQQRRASALYMQQAAQQDSVQVTLGENADGEMTWKDRAGKMIIPSLVEKENLFLDALYAFYAGKPLMSNDDFDTLKDDLSWQGSKTVTLNRDELKFLSAARAYSEGEPIMTDKEFDELKAELRKQGSVVALQTEPKCSVVSQTCWSDCVEDNVKRTVLYLPAMGISAIVWAVIAYEFTPLRSESPLLSLGVGLPIILLIGRVITEAILPDPLILKGKCPSCSSEQSVYFGNIATVDGWTDMAEVNCSNCGSKLTLDRAQRRFRLDMTK